MQILKFVFNSLTRQWAGIMGRDVPVNKKSNRLIHNVNYLRHLRRADLLEDKEK